MCTDLNLGVYDFILLNLRHEFCFWITHLRRLKNLFGEVELCCENWKCKVSNLDATNLYGFRRMSGPKLNDIPFVRSVHIDPLWGWGREMLAESGHSPIFFFFCYCYTCTLESYRWFSFHLDWFCWLTGWITSFTCTVYVNLMK